MAAPTFVQATVALPPVPADALFAVAEGPRALWEPREPGAGARALAGAGVAAHLSGRGGGRFADLAAAAGALFGRIQVAGEAAGAPPPLVLGGFAFAPRARWAAPWADFGDASFVLPRCLLAVGPDRAHLSVTLEATKGAARALDEARRLAALVVAAAPAVEVRRTTAPGGGDVVVEHTRPALWRGMVEDALRRIAVRELDKVVAARCSVVRARGPIDAARVLARLRGPAQPGALFAFERGGATFLGLSPERLVSLRGRRVLTEALAGTGGDPAALLASDKDLREHFIVADGVRRALAPVCRSVASEPVPRVRALPRGLFHLWTPIEGRLARPAHVLDLVRRLHPTAAVAGAPAAAALAWIGAHEPAPRGWYAGPVGWFDAAGDGDFAVAIRSGVVQGDRAWVWAGAGIVPASDPDREWDETRAKQAALLGALGVAPASPARQDALGAGA